MKKNGKLKEMKIEADNSGGSQTQISQLWGIPKLQWETRSKFKPDRKQKRT